MTATTVVAFTVDLEPDCPPFLQGFRGIEQGMPRAARASRERGVCRRRFSRRAKSRSGIRRRRALVADGHELACHGMTHRAFTTLRSLRRRDTEIEGFGRDSSDVCAGDVISRAVPPVSRTSTSRCSRRTASRSTRRTPSTSSHTIAKRTSRDDRARAGIGDVVGAAVCRDCVRARVSRRAVELRRAVRSSVGVRRSATRASCGSTADSRPATSRCECVGDVLVVIARRGARFVRMRELRRR